MSTQLDNVTDTTKETSYPNDFQHLFRVSHHDLLMFAFGDTLIAVCGAVLIDYDQVKLQSTKSKCKKCLEIEYLDNSLNL